MFNFMQGKEFAGQERACGAAAFAAGRNDGARQQQWLHLIASQERCFQVFTEFAGAGAAPTLWRRAASRRRPGRAGAPAPHRPAPRRAGVALDRELSHGLVRLLLARIDAMKAIEERLAADLRALCDAQDRRRRAPRLQANEALLDQSWQATTDGAAAAFFDDVRAAAARRQRAYGHQLERSVLDMLQEQSQRLQAMSDELDTVRAALNERKLVERAKGLLMAHRRMTRGGGAQDAAPDRDEPEPAPGRCGRVGAVDGRLPARAATPELVRRTKRSAAGAIQSYNAPQRHASMRDLMLSIS